MGRFSAQTTKPKTEEPKIPKQRKVLSVAAPPPPPPPQDDAPEEPKVPLMELDKSVQGSNRPTTVRQIIEGLGRIHATIEEMAIILGYSEPTMHAIMKRQPEVRALWETAKATGKASLRRTNFDLAKKNSSMAIFLSKNHLGMRDDVGVEGTFTHKHHVLVSLLTKLDDGQHGKVIEGEVTAAAAPKAIGTKTISEDA